MSGHIYVIFFMVIEPDDIHCTGPEKVVVRSRFVATGSYRPCRIKLLDNLHQFLCQERIKGKFIRKLRLVAGQEIQQQIGLLKVQCVGCRIAPLFQHLVPYAPHHHGRVVTVSAYEVGQVFFVPLFKEHGIIISRFPFAPHVKRFVHDKKPHSVTKIQQFGGRRIVGRSYGIATHFSEQEQLPFHSPPVESCSQGSQIVVQAHTQQFHGSSVQEKPRVGRKAKSPYPKSGTVVVNDGSVLQQQAFHRIQMRGIHIPEGRPFNGQSLVN